MTLQKETVQILNEMLQDFMEKICAEAKVSRQLNRRKTLQAQDIHRAFKLIFRDGAIFKHGYLECEKAMVTYGLSFGEEPEEMDDE